MLPTIYNVVETETILDWVDVVGLMKLNLVNPEVLQCFQQHQVMVAGTKLIKQAFIQIWRI
jgi:hypothetical protein